MNVTPKHGEPAAITAVQKWILLFVSILVLLVFFRQQLQNNFTTISGDRYDGIIVVALLEHWFNVFSGLADWANPNYFYPYQKISSFNDSYFLYGVVYSLFRSASIDPLLSTEFVNIVVKAVGFYGFFFAARRLLKLSFWWALLGAVVFTLSNNTYVQIGHAQLLTVAFIPVEALLMYETYAALVSSQKKHLVYWGCAAALVFSAWLMTSVYIAWFFGLFTSITIAVQMYMGGKAGLRDLRAAVIANRYGVAIVVLVTIISMIPFVDTYILGHHGPRAWNEVLLYSPSILDSINVGEHNLVYGYLISFLKNSCHACNVGSGELEAGIAPLLMVLAGMCIFSLMAKKIVPPGNMRIFVVGLAVALLITWILSVRVHTHTAWYIVYKLWPGGTGLRVVSRIFLFFSAPVVALAVWYLSRKSATWPKFLVILLSVLLMIEEINVVETVGLNRAHELKLTTTVSAPPKACRAFYVTASPDSDLTDSGPYIATSLLHNIDAMLIAEYVNLPTINGHSSFLPDDWNFSFPARGDYFSRIDAYAKRHHVSNLCRLDLNTLRWSINMDTPRSPAGLAVWDFTSTDAGGDTLQGFDASEPFGRWSRAQHASFAYSLLDSSATAGLFRITVANALVNAHHPQKVLISVNGGEKHEFTFYTMGRRVIDLPFAAGFPEHGTIAFDFPDAASPKDLGMGNDERRLAIAVESIEVRR
jgi:hypothetical protein